MEILVYCSIFCNDRVANCPSIKCLIVATITESFAHEILYLKKIVMQIEIVMHLSLNQTHNQFRIL